MALWGGLGHAATVAQLVGVDVGGLVSMIIQSAVTARQNKEECQLLARRVLLISQLLSQLQEAEVVQWRMAGLDDALRESHELVVSCQDRRMAYRLVMAGRQADKFREVQRRIDSCLLIFPIVSHIDITRRFDGNYNVPIPSGGTTMPSTSAGHGSQFQTAWKVPYAHGIQEFTFKKLAAATKNFAPDTMINEGSFGMVHKGCFSGGKVMAIKRRSKYSMFGEEEFQAEVTILSSIRHKHIVRLLGWCMVEEEKLLLPFMERKEMERILIYEYMENGSLFDHLHSPKWSSSPVRASWKMRIKTLLGVSQAIEYLHVYALPPVIHRDIKASNIMFDSTWAPRLIDFGLSLTWDETECSGICVKATTGYADPEYMTTGNLKPASDVYSFGVLMLEVLIGREPFFYWEDGEENNSTPYCREYLVDFALSLIEAGEVQKLLDKRQATEPTLRELEAVNLVAQTAARCLQLEGKERPAISEVAANLQAALELVERIFKAQAGELNPRDFTEVNRECRVFKLPTSRQLNEDIFYFPERHPPPSPLSIHLLARSKNKIQVNSGLAMALWGGLGQAATVAQLVGADVGSLISIIMQAAVTARQNKKECEQLARRVFMIAELLPHLQDPEVMCRPEIRRPLVGLDDTLREAHELVMSCQEKSVVHRLVMAGRQAEKFREVQSRIDSYLLVFPFISHIDITRRLDRIYKVLLPNDVTPPSQEFAENLAEEVAAAHGEDGEKFTMAEIEAATNNFAQLIGRGGVSNVYMGRLPDGLEVAIKIFTDCDSSNEEFVAERTILTQIRHKHIIRLIGCCLERQRYKKEMKRSRWFWKKKIMDVVEPVLEPPILVFEHMINSSLDKHIHGSLSSSSPVMTSWSMRMEILLGVSRAIEYLHTHTERPVIHRDIKLSNILLDKAWVPRLSDFGLAFAWDEMECSDLPLSGTPGYCDPEYFATNIAKPAIDLFSFGVVMLEVLTGMKPIFRRKEEEDDDEEEDEDEISVFHLEEGGIPTSLASFAVPLIEAGKLWKLLDRRPTAEPTQRQLQAADLVAHTAARCVHFEGKERPVISEVVASLQEALELVRGDGGLEAKSKSMVRVLLSVK
uniref:Protein kinase domain-containing protein n=1 Tax=Leersia perrieri TaxID=77586 RepID=A0A0D9XV40_9ORYZ